MVEILNIFLYFSIGNVEHHPPEPEVRRTRKTKHRSSKLLAIGGVTNISGKSGKRKKRVENSMVCFQNLSAI